MSTLQRLSFLAATALLSVPLSAATALFKNIPWPEDSNYLTLSSEGGNEITVDFEYRLYGGSTSHWNPGFRTATSGAYTFVVGWTWNTSIDMDGFISKVDPGGSIVWTKNMRNIMSTAAIGWCINDIAIYGENLFVCGQRSDNTAFVAKVTTNGTVLDYTLIEGNATDFTAIGRANSIYVSIVNNQPRVFLTGEVKADSMQLQQKQLSAPATTFSNLVIREAYGTVHYFDAFVLRFDINLAAEWGTTLGYHWSDDYGTAIAADGSDAIFVALKYENPERNGDAVMSHVDDNRKIITAANQAGTFISGGAYHDYDFWPGSHSILFRLDTSGTASIVTSYFLPAPDQEDRHGTNTRIVDIAYDNGSLYLGGNFETWYNPLTHNQGNVGGELYSLYSEGTNHSNDIFLTRLDPSNLYMQNHRIYRSSQEDFLNQIVVSGDNLYIAGVAGAALEHLGPPLSTSASGTDIGGSSSPHLFWAKLSTPELNHTWHIFPVEDSSAGIAIPLKQRSSGIAAIGDRVMLLGSYYNGAITMGSSTTRKTLDDYPGWAGWWDQGFVGFIKDDGTWLEEIGITINSEFGSPTPHSGFGTVATGESITASVPATVYEDALGNIIDSADAEAIRNRAVTRRICIGYQFDNSDVNGTVNSVSFVPTADVSLTFLWRTEHAIEIFSDLIGSEGLTSPAAGNPEPAVKKHWIEENEQFTAFVDGEDSSLANQGTRWLSTGFLATGSVAQSLNINNNSMLRWENFQDRQQTSQITVSGPGTITWRWRKQHRLTISTNSSVAEDSPTTYNDRPAPTTQLEPTSSNIFFVFKFENFPVSVTRIKLRASEQAIAALPTHLRVMYETTPGNYGQTIVSMPTLEADVPTYIDVSTATAFSSRWYVSGTDSTSSAWTSPGVEVCEIDRVAFDPANPPTAPHLKSGTGEFWFEPGSSVTASAAASVSSGISTLTLKGYTGGTGSVSPYDTRDVTTKSFTIHKDSRLTWDYARAIYPETVTIGNALTFASVTGTDATNIDATAEPVSGSIISAPSGSSLSDMYTWDAVAQKVYPLRPGIFTLEFTNLAARDDPAQNVIIQVTSQWPTSPTYTHVLEAPAVELEPSTTDANAFLSVAYSEGGNTSSGSLFSTVEPGWSTLVFSTRIGEVATGNTAVEPLAVRTVQSFRWPQITNGLRTATTIGEAITFSGHDSASVGHNGFSLTPLAPINSRTYDRATRSGTLFAVNEQFPDVAQWLTPVPGPTNGLIAHFTFDESFGTTETSKVDGSSATFQSNTPGDSPNWIQPGVALTAANGEYFMTNNTTGNGITNAFTLAAWINPAAFADWNGIITKGTSVSAYSLCVSSSNRLRFAANWGTSDPNQVNDSFIADSTAALDLDSWSHVAVSYDGTTLRMFINGSQAGSSEVALRCAEIAEPLVFGADLGGAPEYWDGAIRDARVYNRPLSTDEITALNAVTNIQAGPADLAIAWYRVQDNIRWPYTAVHYQPFWPSNPDRIVIASQLGSEGLNSAATVQTPFDGTTLKDPLIYNQPDPTLQGFNPNEEHALIAPSFLDPTRAAAFALHRDLNQTAHDANFTSQPYVLVEFTDATVPASPVSAMKVYAIAEEDAATTDARLPAFNQAYTFFYQGTAGLRLVPPYPLDLVLGGAAHPAETNGENVDNRIAYYEDKNDMPWIVSGDTDPAADIHAAWFYPLRADFWHPTASTGDPVPLAELSVSTPRNIDYNTIWPADVAVLKAGETLTFSGGEYATDHAGDELPPQGLPSAAAWQSGKLVFDSTNPAMLSAVMATHYLARLVPALETREVDLALSAMPDALRPASGNVSVEGLLWFFKDLPASLQRRVFYNAGTAKLSLRGLLNDRPLGDGDLLTTPGAQTLLQPNVLTAPDEIIVKAISTNGDWIAAVASLAALSRNPNNTLFPGVSTGLEPDPDVLNAHRYVNAFGPGLAVITNPALQDPTTAVDFPSGYITIAENDQPSLSSPVAMHVIRVSREKYRGSIVVMEPANVFDEKLSLKHTADFGGNVDELYFQWFYREEDGRNLNPPNVSLPTDGTPSGADWVVFDEGPGKVEVQLAGSGPILIRDNLFFCRYRHVNDPTGTDWSAYAGAANSREPNPASPSATIDTAYVAQLAPGWIKRVTNAVNLFDARFDDFRNNDAPATYSSAIQQAGQRKEGPVAFNPDKDAIENVGLIELYETVLDRGEALTIASNPGTDGVNTALLNAANRIAKLYSLLGDEAFSDALNPMIGFSTTDDRFGSLAPTIHPFQNVTANLLEEEIALLRGRPEVGARPAYNRLVWNFTNGDGEAAYVMNYGITDVSTDGFIDDEDARRLFPQGHGDAWGHYTMALRGYYRLARLDNFAWSARSEKFNIDGIVIDVDYLDERAFAQTAARRAKSAAALTSLVYRQAYTENPNGQWQGYRDSNSDRAWGVFETAQRSGTAALCDWLMANSLLKAEESDPAKSGIRKVDRSTVPDLATLSRNASAIQATLDSADNGMNPQGLDPNVIPFDIDPARITGDYAHASHFTQVFERAAVALQNAKLTFDYANDLALQLRQTAASAETLRTQTADQDRSLRNALIRVFGSPYQGMIGAGKAYPAGYNGPDLYLYMYVDHLDAAPGLLPDFSESLVETTIVPGLLNLDSDTNPFSNEDAPLEAYFSSTFRKFFPNDLDVPSEAPGSISLNLPRRSSSYAFVAPDSWGARARPGEFQMAIQQLVEAEWAVRTAIYQYTSQADDFKNLLNVFELKSGIAAEMLQVSRSAIDDNDHYTDLAIGLFSATQTIHIARESAMNFAQALSTSIPEVAGIAASAGAAAKSAPLMVAAAADLAARLIALPMEALRYRAELKMQNALGLIDALLIPLEQRSELIDILSQIAELVNDEQNLLHEVIASVEALHSAAYRVNAVLEDGLAILDERISFNQHVAATTTRQRYEDFTFRVFHNQALQKYHDAFDLAARYVYLAGKAFLYELNLPDYHPANPSILLAESMKARTIGIFMDGQPAAGAGGLSEILASLKTNFDAIAPQFGVNDFNTDISEISLRSEFSRTGLGSRVNADWRTALEDYRVPDLWNYEYTHDGINYGYIFRRFCRPFAAEDSGPQPALVIPFASTIEAGKNWFGHSLSGGDHAFNPSNFSTKIRSLGLRFDGYNPTALAMTPQVYLVPVGDDRMFYPDSLNLDFRSFNVVDQRIPLPLALTAAQVADPDWLPFSSSANGFFEDVRKFSSFRAYHDAGGWSTTDMLTESRHIGRSVWNSQWVLIIPSQTLLFDAANPQAGLDTLIYGAPLSGFDQSTAGTANRDLLGVRDIRILLQTYNVSGN